MTYSLILGYKLFLSATNMYMAMEWSGHVFQNANVVGILKDMTRTHYLCTETISNGYTIFFEELSRL